MAFRITTGIEKLVRFRCGKCAKDLLWTTASAVVQCPTCGRWVKSNTFWRPKIARRKFAEPKTVKTQEQMVLFD